MFEKPTTDDRLQGDPQNRLVLEWLKAVRSWKPAQTRTSQGADTSGTQTD